MNRLLKLGTLAALLTSANAYAHHPAADIVDPEVYAMIEENISDVHLAMEFDDMGRDSADMDQGKASRDSDTDNMTRDMTAEMTREMTREMADNMADDIAGDMTRDMTRDMTADMAAEMGRDLESISNDLAESASPMSGIEPGSMARQR
ncbi:MAG: hypothetical protein OQK46_10740 [Gammaproteobacteria bacterium]|nr:hypothetical protein [Gammaproteobacteria bacterium]